MRRNTNDAARAEARLLRETGPTPVATADKIDDARTMDGDVRTMVLPTDDRFADQYHLRNTTAGEHDLGLFRGNRSVWDEFTGEGVHVGVIDDGIDVNHSDLNYDASREAVVGGVTISGNHTIASDAHGTAVAGIIGAQRNGVGTVGIAYGVTVTGMGAISDSPTISIEDSYANYAQFDVINNSWGYTSPWYDNAYRPELAVEHALLDEMLAEGRGGLGTIFVKSAGNSRDAFDNTAFSHTNSNFGSITVAAVLRDGTVSYYSTEGASLLISAFGGPVPGDVVTTDRTGAAGYDAGNYTSSFNGTSAAAPMITAIVALMLEANPDLGYRDVMQILAATALHTGTAIGNAPTGDENYDWSFNGATNWNGGGMHFSEDYGFGLVNAFAAVRLAESWTRQDTTANLTTLAASETSFTGPVDITDNSSDTITFTMAAGVTVEQIAINLGMSHTYTGDLVITLTSPSGTVSTLLNRNGSGANLAEHGTFDFTLTSNAFRGESSAGVWTLVISDLAGGDVGVLSAIEFTALGASDANDTYVFTEEYSDYVTAGRQSLIDTDGGNDTINASAVFSASVINLGNNTVSTVDGVTFTTNGSMENAIGGDGGDTLTGHNRSNSLRGMRGDDVLFGSLGDDILDGGVGDDALDGGGGLDTADFSGTAARRVVVNLETGLANGGAGRDTLAFIENVLGSNFNDVLTGDGLSNTLMGGSGDDILDGGLGDDILAGNEGRDAVTYYVATAGVTVDLSTIGPQNTGSFGIDTLTSIEDVIGSRFNDVLSGDGFNNTLSGQGGQDTISGGGGADRLNGEGGTDILSGGANNDRLTGGLGADIMTGGTGADVFIYLSTSESTTINRDLITDMAANDILSLTAIDANVNLANDQGFTIVGSLTGVAGQMALSYSAGTNQTLLLADVNGDGIADFSIAFTGNVTGMTGTWLL